MAFSDLCHISNAYKDVENEVDQSDRIMEENAMVRDLISKILDESGTEGSSSIPQPPPQEKSINSIPPSQFLKNDAGSSYMPFSSSFPYDNNLFNFTENAWNFAGLNEFNTNGYVNFPDYTNSLLTIDPITEEAVTPEQLNLLRLAAQEIGGAQFQSPTQFDEKYYNFFEPNQRNSFPETNMYPPTFTLPNSLNIDTNYSNYDYQFNQRFPNKFENGFMIPQNQDSTDLLAYFNQLTLSGERPREDLQSNDFKMPIDMSGAFQENFNKMQEERNKLFLNGRNFQQEPNKFNGDFYLNDVMAQSDRNLGQIYDFSNPPNIMGYKPNGFQQQNDFVQRRDLNPGMPREVFPNNVDRNNFDNLLRENQQQLIRHQELAIQMSMFIRSRPPPNPLNVDVTFIHENTPFNFGVGAIMGPSPPQPPPPVLPSPVLDIPVLAPFYIISDMRTTSTSSSILHARLDDCYEQWRQIERERKRTEARLALAYPGRAVSSSNSIPVPRLPPCPTRVDRLTVDMLREHTKELLTLQVSTSPEDASVTDRNALTLMGKMETLRASVCVAQNKKPNKVEDGRITVLRRGQEKVPLKELDPATFDPASWKEDIKHFAEIAPHSEIENAMLAWRNAVAGVQAARRRELASHASSRYYRTDPILQLAAAVKQLCVCARRARAAMWCDLTITVALAPHHSVPQSNGTSAPAQASPKQSTQEPSPSTSSAKPAVEQKEVKPSTDNQTKNETKPEDTKNKEKNRRSQNYRKVNRNDFYTRNLRYDNRFVRHPYHYLATGPIN